jgi:hypothetical protein
MTPGITVEVFIISTFVLLHRLLLSFILKSAFGNEPLTEKGFVMYDEQPWLEVTSKLAL